MFQCLHFAYDIAYGCALHFAQAGLRKHDEFGIFDDEQFRWVLWQLRRRFVDVSVAGWFFCGALLVATP